MKSTYAYRPGDAPGLMVRNCAEMPPVHEMFAVVYVVDLRRHESRALVRPVIGRAALKHVEALGYRFVVVTLVPTLKLRAVEQLCNDERDVPELSRELLAITKRAHGPIEFHALVAPALAKQVRDAMRETALELAEVGGVA
jgi:hypothetical protein